MSHSYDPRRRQEVTVPVSFSAQEGAPGAHDKREARLIVGIALGSGLMLGLVSVVLFQLTLHLFRAAVPSPVTGGACSESKPCPEGYICQENLCLPAVAPSEVSCEPYDTCGTEDSACICKEPSTCDNHSCIPPKQAQSSACDDPLFQKLLTRVAKKCDGDIGKCPPDKLKDFALDSADFDEIIRLVPETITIHFMGGAPNLSAEEEDHYLKRMTDLKVIESLRNAKVTLLIGRSSKGGSSFTNDEISRLRGQKARTLIEELVKRTNTDDKTRARILGTTKQLILGNRKIIQPDFFKDSYRNRLIAWTDAEESRLLSNLRNYEQLSRKEKRWTRNLINQVALVVPIACELPRVTDAQPEEPEATR